jgi:hypothetical protein
MCIAWCSFLIWLGGGLSSFDPLPSLTFFFRLGFWAIALEVAMFMAEPTLKRKLFIIKFLEMRPRAYREFDGFWKTCLQINFNTNPCVGVLPFMLCFVNEVS